MKNLVKVMDKQHSNFSVKLWASAWLCYSNFEKNYGRTAWKFWIALWHCPIWITFLLSLYKISRANI